MFAFLPDYTWLVVLPAFFLLSGHKYRCSQHINANAAAGTFRFNRSKVCAALDEAGLSNVGGVGKRSAY